MLRHVLCLHVAIAAVVSAPAATAQCAGAVGDGVVWANDGMIIAVREETWGIGWTDNRTYVPLKNWTPSPWIVTSSDGEQVVWRHDELDGCRILGSSVLWTNLETGETREVANESAEVVGSSEGFALRVLDQVDFFPWNPGAPARSWTMNLSEWQARGLPEPGRLVLSSNASRIFLVQPTEIHIFRWENGTNAYEGRVLFDPLARVVGVVPSEEGRLAIMTAGHGRFTEVTVVDLSRPSEVPTLNTILPADIVWRHRSVAEGRSIIGSAFGFVALQTERDPVMSPRINSEFLVIRSLDGGIESFPIQMGAVKPGDRFAIDAARLTVVFATNSTFTATALFAPDAPQDADERTRCESCYTPAPGLLALLLALAWAARLPRRHAAAGTRTAADR